MRLSCQKHIFVVFQLVGLFSWEVAGRFAAKYCHHHQQTAMNRQQSAWQLPVYTGQEVQADHFTP